MSSVADFDESFIRRINALSIQDQKDNPELISKEKIMLMTKPLEYITVFESSDRWIVYFLFNVDVDSGEYSFNDLVYIGVAKNLYARLQGHVKGKYKKKFNLIKYTSLSYVDGEEIHEADSETPYNIERVLIRVFNPKYNKNHSTWKMQCGCCLGRPDVCECSIDMAKHLFKADK